MPDASVAPRHLAARLGPLASLKEVRLRRAQAELHLPVDPVPPSRYELEFEVEWYRERELLLYFVDTDISIDVIGGDSDLPSGTTIWTCTSSFVLTYELDPELEASDEEFGAYGNVCALFSAYPYIRELAQSLTTRSGLPPLTLDVLTSPLDQPE